jgi:23S rRNA (cytosine1962-C5)-methyltransferase
MKLKKIILKKGSTKKIQGGHLWIYSNEIDAKKTRFSEFFSGELVLIETHDQQKLGIGYFNPHTLISVRILTRDSEETIEQNFFWARFKNALALREQFFQHPFYRLIFAESDDLPGLIVDRFDQVLVVQINTAGMEQLKNLFLPALINLLKPKAIILKNDTAFRQMEGLPLLTEIYFGDLGKEIIIEENQSRFLIPILEGQKTGWFFDQAENHLLARKIAKNKKVLDVFSYVGGFGINAFLGGAKEVSFIESSEFAASFIKRNLELNQIKTEPEVFVADAFLSIKKMLSEKRFFDLIILDPPAFIKKRKDLKEGTIAYLRLHEMALRLLNPNGFLLTTSCSMHFERELFLDVLRRASLKSQRKIKILMQLHQSKDHPIHPAILETDYLKGFLLEVL